MEKSITVKLGKEILETLKKAGAIYIDGLGVFSVGYGKIGKFIIFRPSENLLEGLNNDST